MRANLIFRACFANLTGTDHPASFVATAWAIMSFYSNLTFYWFRNAGLCVLFNDIFVTHVGSCTIFMKILVYVAYIGFNLFSALFFFLTKRIQQKVKIASKTHSKRKHWNIWVNIFTTELLHLHFLLLSLSSLLLFFEFFCGSFISPTHPWLLNQLIRHYC